MSNPVRVIITGCRKWACRELATQIVGRLVARYGTDHLAIIHGACETGADAAFDAAAVAAGVTIERYPAEWDRLGKRAGPERNSLMVAAGADFAIAVHRSLAWSKGTGDCVKKLLAADIPVYLIDAPDGEPRRIREVPKIVKAGS